MDEPDLVAVEATEERFRALKHQPSQAGFDEDGRGLWPADQFTFRLRNEGAIRMGDDVSKVGEADGVDKAPIEMPADGSPRTLLVGPSETEEH